MSINMELRSNTGTSRLLSQQYPYQLSNTRNNFSKMFWPPPSSSPIPNSLSESTASSKVHNTSKSTCGGNCAHSNSGLDEATDGADAGGLLYWAYAARLSCVVALLPMVLFANNEKITKSAACIHLLLTPVTSFFLQNFSYARCREKSAKIISCFLSGVCFVLGNSAAVILLASDDAKLVIVWVNGFLSAALCLGSGQLLMVLHKGNVVRVMACTAAAVMVVVLAILGSVAPLNMTKRFFQSAAIPFLLLFLETSRLRSAPPRQQQPDQVL